MQSEGLFAFIGQVLRYNMQEGLKVTKTEEIMIKGHGYRITVLTDRLIRLEYDAEERFVDSRTQLAMNREFSECEVRVERENGNLCIDTGALLIRYDEKPFETGDLAVTVKSTGATWHCNSSYGNREGNFWGTGRTLDCADGFILLEKGIFGEQGYGVLDDSASPVLEDGEFKRRESKGRDLYFFGYGKAYREGLQDFMKLTGSVPMLPRYALGNWWSRYHRYTEEEYTDLLNRFREEKIPLSVGVIDMDWHLTNVDPKYGSGWTGYTWDPECFPDPDRFLKELKERKLAVTLNLHPADGVRAFEEPYGRVAEHLGMDPKEEETIPFDFQDPAFREAYFQEIMQPMEEKGVDFWWIDWQQGTGKKEGDLDPLLLLNHYHFEDQRKAGKRAMIFSRYAGPGSHRYPVGFSGDTVMSWKSLEFQPYFTSNASNIGYGWWSHDIGGHMLGSKDEERLIRWIQLGVFSPVMRLHSSNSPFFNKEPWTLKEPYRSICGNFMRLRHKLVPYLYTMNELSHREARMLCEPMYYECPDSEQAYRVRGEYTFGTELIVGSITKPCDPELRKAAAYMYLPEGKWYDLFSGRIYRKSGARHLYRGVEEVPVLLRAGGIVPLDALEAPENGTANPEKLQILLGSGADGNFELYEDDGVSMKYEQGACVRTKMTMECGGSETTFYIAPAVGDLSLIPEKRSYKICLYGVCPEEGAGAVVTCGGERVEVSVSDCNADATALVGCASDYDSARLVYDSARHIATVTVPGTAVTEEISVVFRGFTEASNDLCAEVFRIMDDAWCDTLRKEQVFDHARSAADPAAFARYLAEADIPPAFREALEEILD